MNRTEEKINSIELFLSNLSMMQVSNTPSAPASELLDGKPRNNHRSFYAVEHLAKTLLRL
jgi:hypothetical protein